MTSDTDYAWICRTPMCPIDYFESGSCRCPECNHCAARVSADD